MPLKPEQIVHINLVNWFHYQYSEFAEDFHHFANERQCSIQQGKLLKRMGVKRGVADFFLALPFIGSLEESLIAKAGLWVELKVGTNKPTKEQIAFAHQKIQRGYEFAFVWGLEEAKVTFVNYVNNYRASSSINAPKNCS